MHFAKGSSLSKPFFYRLNKFVYPTKTGKYEKQDNAYDYSYSECLSNQIHGLSPSVKRYRSLFYAATNCQAAMKPGNLDAFASKDAVARHPSRRFLAPIKQSAKSAVVSFQMKRASSMAGSKN
jgi:hypothetical protein